MIDTSAKHDDFSGATSHAKVNRVYITLLTMVAALGGLLFGYDTAVVNGAEKSLTALYITPIMGSANADYVVAMITQYRSLLIVVLFIVLLFFGWLWGIWGLLLGAPLLAIAKVICDRIQSLKPLGELLGR